MKATRYDTQYLKLDSITPEGFLQTDGVVARVCILVYVNKDGSVSREAIFYDDMWDEASIATMRMLPIVNTHRGGMVTPENLKARKIGHLGENIRPDGPGDPQLNVLAPIRIDTAEGLEALEDGRLQLSLGYECEVVDEAGELVYVDEDGNEFRDTYDKRQINRRYNHLAIVDEARAGEEAQIRMDSVDAVQSEEQHTPSFRSDDMNKKKIKLDAVAGIPALHTDQAEYEVDACISIYLEDLRIAFLDAQSGRMDALTRLAAANERADASVIAKDKADGERDTAVEALAAEKVDAKAKLDSAARERVAIILAAEPHVDAATFKNFDSMTNREIQVAAVKAISPKFDDTGKSDDYVTSRFDSSIEGIGSVAVGEQRKQFVKLDNAPAAHEDTRDITVIRADAKESQRKLREDTRAKHFNSKKKG